MLNVAGQWHRPGFDAGLWLLDLRWLQAAPGSGLAGITMTVIGLALIGGATPLVRRPWIGRAISVVLAATAAACLGNAIGYWAAIIGARIASRLPVPVPMSLPMGLLVTMLAWRAWPRWRHGASSSEPARDSHGGGPVPSVIARLAGGMLLAVLSLGWAVVFCLGQMLFFGSTDYRRPADAIVVLGARAYPDGSLSDALRDRVRTGVELHREGLAPRLIFSGGEVSPGMTEPQAMRKYAIERGVPPSVIYLDPRGMNTQASVTQTTAMFRRLGVQRVLVVSHGYHLPRIKLAYARAGWEVWTVPARESYTLSRMPWLVAREVAALGAYYLRPLHRPTGDGGAG